MGNKEKPPAWKLPLLFDAYFQIFPINPHICSGFFKGGKNFSGGSQREIEENWEIFEYPAKILSEFGKKRNTIAEI